MERGTVTLYVSQATGINSAAGSLCYVIVRLMCGDKELEKRKTNRVEGTTEVIWDSEVFSFENVDPTMPLSLQFKLKDRHTLRKDPLVGRGSVPVEALASQEPGVPQELLIDLTGAGTLACALAWTPETLLNEGLNPMESTKFFRAARMRLKRDYIVLVDRSGSMAGGRWRRAEQAMTMLAPMVCRADPDGISLYFFNNESVHFDHVQSAGQVNEIFAQNPPTGGTLMAGPLKSAIGEHFANKKMATTILVVSDGEPADQDAVKNTIIAAANKIKRPDDLSITFIQIGKDAEATSFLMHLDDELNTKFDIVDTLTSEEMMGMEFSELIEKSITD